jgi:hypothetical protein
MLSEIKAGILSYLLSLSAVVGALQMPRLRNWVTGLWVGYMEAVTDGSCSDGPRRYTAYSCPPSRQCFSSEFLTHHRLPGRAGNGKIDELIVMLLVTLIDARPPILPASSEISTDAHLA